MKTILIGGYYGAGNIGDEAILDAMLEAMRARRDDLSFFVTSWNPEETGKQFDVKGIHWKDINALLNAGRQADMIVLGGGGLFQDYWEMDPKSYLRKDASGIVQYGSLPLLAKILGIPCMIYAVGIGPLQSKLGREHTRLAFERCQVASVRDAESLGLLAETGFEVREGAGTLVEVTADPVFALTTSAEDEAAVGEYLRRNQMEDAEFIGVNLRYWNRPGPIWTWLPYVAEGLTQFLTSNPQLHVALIPFQDDSQNQYNDDASILKNLAPFLPNRERVHLVEKPPTARYAQALIKRCQLVVGMRLHAAILALNEATPVVALSYDPKVASLMKQAGLREYCIETLTPRPEEFAVCLQQAWDQRVALRSLIHPQQAKWKQAAQRNAALAMALLSEGKIDSSDFARQFALEQLSLQFEVDTMLEQRTEEKRVLQERVWELNEVIEQSTKDINAIIKQKTQEIYDLTEQGMHENDALQRKVVEANSDISSLTSQVSALAEQASLLNDRLKEIEASKFTKIARLYYRLAQSGPFGPIYRFMSQWKQKGLTGAIGKTIDTAKEKIAAAPVRAIIPALNARLLKGVFVVTSAFVFDELYNQRVINLSKYLSREGWGVIYVAWRWSKEEAMAGIGEEVYPNIFQVPVDMFLEYLPDLAALEHDRKFFVVEFPHPDFLTAALKLRRYGFPIIYEIIDEWEEFHKAGQSPWFTGPVEKAMVLNANVLTAVSRPLVDKFADLRRDIHLLPNGFDPALLGEGHRKIARCRFSEDSIHLGYFGHLTDSWFDWDFVLRVLDLAKERGPNLHFHLIGYGSPNLEKKLAGYRERVTLYGKVQPADLHEHVRKWDAAIIPFRTGKLSEAVDPIKIYEYLYFGLPVIVTGITHLKELPRVRVVKSEPEFLEALAELGEETRSQSSDISQRVEQTLAGSTWGHRFSTLVHILETEEWMSL